MPSILTKKERNEELSNLIENGWEMIDGRDAIYKEFKFKSFINAFGWMSSIALISEKLDHHPEWSNVYNTVEVTLTTHSANGLTKLDLALAKKMDIQKNN